MDKIIEKLEMLDTIPNIFVLTGPGISSESGFNIYDNLKAKWKNHDLNNLLSPKGFRDNPELVYDFINHQKNLIKTCSPNQAHLALAELEMMLENAFCMATKNIDPFHEQAGSKNVFYMYGRLNEARCKWCHITFPWQDNLDKDSFCYSCDATLVPSSFFFGSQGFYYGPIQQTIGNCDLLLIVGISGSTDSWTSVFWEDAKDKGASIVEIDTKPSGCYSDYFIEGKISEGVPFFVDAIKSVLS